jgi:hypothetical protein
VGRIITDLTADIEKLNTSSKPLEHLIWELIFVTIILPQATRCSDSSLDELQTQAEELNWEPVPAKQIRNRQRIFAVFGVVRGF